MSQGSGESRPPLFQRLAQILGNKTPSDPPADKLDIPAELAKHPRYQFFELLGTGGMGAVFKGRHTLMDRLVAVKVMHSNLLANPKAAERFANEVRTAAQLSHPNIVAAYDAEQVGQLHFLAMEFVPGQNLAELVAQRGRLPISQACDFIRQAAQGLQHAHECGMVHRDIKPHNLILTPQGQVKILDFGLARFLSESRPGPPRKADASNLESAPGLTQAGVIMGSPDYMSPEQAIDAHHADIRADIYSLGCTLYQLLTGSPPFPSGSTPEKLSAHRDRMPAEARRLRPEISAELSALVARMMAKKPEARPQSPDEVVAALTPFCGAGGPGLRSARRRVLPRQLLFALVPVILATLATLTYIAVSKFREPPVKPDSAVSGKEDWKEIETPKLAAPREKPPPIIIAQQPSPTTQEWLVARTEKQILKVAQDGSGDFRTIQQALNAVRAGQAIIIQDRGPYREQLNAQQLPPDVGLISHVGTRIEIPHYENTGKGKTSVLRGAHLNATRGFRMSGIEWVGASLPERAHLGNLVYLGLAGDVVIERCSFQGPEELIGLNCNGRGMPDPTTRVLIQQNLFHQGWAINNVVGDLVVQHNFAHSPSEGLVCGGLMGTAVIRHNVLFAANQPLLFLQRIQPSQAREFLVHNNVFSNGKFGSIRVQDPNSHQPELADKWHVANNVFLGLHSCGFYLPLNFKAGLASGGASHWEVGPNAYQNAPTDIIGNELWPIGARDIVVNQPFAKVGPSHPDYLRVSLTSPLAQGGSGNGLPKYFGVLPPGPAPKNDFSRLLSEAPPLWKKSGESRPTISSAAEFLAKHKVLTVAQDGSAEFKSIRAALESLKTGEAILIKDKGPYREHIEIQPPGNTALISLVGTRIEVDRYSRVSQNLRNYVGAKFQLEAGGFLMHGIEWTDIKATLPKEAFGGSLVQFNAANDLVIERCSFIATEKLFSLACSGFRPRGRPPRILLQENRLDRLHVYGIEGTALIQNNWMKTPQIALLLGEISGHVTVRHNVLEAGGWPLHYMNFPFVRNETSGQLDIHNNVFISNKAASIALLDAPIGKTRLLESIRIANNIFYAQENSGIHMPANFRSRLEKSITIGPNAYQAKPRATPTFEPLPVNAGDKTVSQPFLSDRPDHVNYLRIAVTSELAEEGEGGELPEYMGALPPGPAPPDGDWFTRLRSLIRQP